MGGNGLLLLAGMLIGGSLVALWKDVVIDRLEREAEALWDEIGYRAEDDL